MRAKVPDHLPDGTNLDDIPAGSYAFVLNEQPDLPPGRAFTVILEKTPSGSTVHSFRYEDNGEEWTHIHEIDGTTTEWVMVVT